MGLKIYTIHVLYAVYSAIRYVETSDFILWYWFRFLCSFLFCSFHLPHPPNSWLLQHIKTLKMINLMQCVVCLLHNVVVISTYFFLVSIQLGWSNWLKDSLKVFFPLDMIQYYEWRVLFVWQDISYFFRFFFRFRQNAFHLDTFLAIKMAMGEWCTHIKAIKLSYNIYGGWFALFYLNNRGMEKSIYIFFSF